MRDLTKSPLTRGNLMGGAVLMQFGFTYLASFALSLFCAVFDKSGSLAKLIFGDDLIV